MLEYKNYVLKVATGCKDRFDLHERGINKKTGEPKLDWIGYGYLFENAIEKIIRIEAGANKDVTTLREYVTEYHRLLSETQSLINKADISKQKKVS